MVSPEPNQEIRFLQIPAVQNLLNPFSYFFKTQHPQFCQRLSN